MIPVGEVANPVNGQPYGPIQRRGVAIEPGSEAWLRLITPSKVAAICGVSRWESPFRLWHRMKGNVPPEPPKDAFDVGHDMEPYAANRWRRKNPGWLLSPGEVQFSIPTSHFGFPAAVTLDRRAVRGSLRRVVEAKIARTITDLEQWGDDLTGDCPEDYALQVTAQRVFVAAAQGEQPVTWEPLSHLIAIGPYYTDRLYEIECDPSVVAWMIGECARFHKSLEADVAPDLDNSVQTYECLKQLHPDIDAGAHVSLEPSLAIDYLEADEAEKQSKAALQGAKNRLLAAMGRAQYAKVGDVVVADRRGNGKGGVSLYKGRAASPDNIRQQQQQQEGMTA